MQSIAIVLKLNILPRTSAKKCSCISAAMWKKEIRQVKTEASPQRLTRGWERDLGCKGF